MENQTEELTRNYNKPNVKPLIIVALITGVVVYAAMTVMQSKQLSESKKNACFAR